MALEESFSLVDYKNTSGSAFFTHLFQEQADATMTKMAKEILEAKSDGYVYILCNQVNAIESSLWYNSANRSAKVTTEKRRCVHWKWTSHSAGVSLIFEGGWKHGECQNFYLPGYFEFRQLF